MSESKWYLEGSKMTKEQALYYVNQKIISDSVNKGEREILYGLKAFIEHIEGGARGEGKVEE